MERMNYHRLVKELTIMSSFLENLNYSLCNCFKILECNMTLLSEAVFGSNVEH